MCCVMCVLYMNMCVYVREFRINIRLRYEDMYFWMSNKIKMFEEGCNF